MMKQIACLLALVALVNAGPIPDELNSESFLNPTDTEETSNLVGDMEIFSDYCIQSRDHILGSIKDGSNGIAAGIFSTIMNTAEAVGRDVLDTQRMATDRLGNQIANPNAAIVEGESELERKVAAGQRAIQEQQTQPQTFFQAILTTVGASRDIVVQRISAGFESVKEKLGVNQALIMLEKGCGLMSKYEDELRALFDEAKAEIVAVKPSLANVKFEQVPCVTSRRVIRADGVCQFAKSAQGPVTKMLQTRSRAN